MIYLLKTKTDIDINAKTIKFSLFESNFKDNRYVMKENTAFSYLMQTRDRYLIECFLDYNLKIDFNAKHAYNSIRKTINFNNPSNKFGLIECNQKEETILMQAIEVELYYVIYFLLRNCDINIITTSSTIEKTMTSVSSFKKETSALETLINKFSSLQKGDYMSYFDTLKEFISNKNIFINKHLMIMSTKELMKDDQIISFYEERSAIHLAVVLKFLKVLEALLKSKDIDVNEKRLMTSVFKAKGNTTKVSNEETALHIAASCPYQDDTTRDMIRALLKHPRIDTFSLNGYGKIPVDCAIDGETIALFYKK